MNNDDDLSFGDLFNEAKTIANEHHRTTSAKRRELQRVEHEYVTKEVKAAAAAGKRKCRLSNYKVSRETISAISKHFKVKEAHEGVNPSTHDPMFVGWDIEW